MTLSELATKLTGVKPEELTATKIPYAGKEVTKDGAKVVAGDDLSIPDFCRLPASERGQNDKEAIEMGKKLAADKKIPVPPASAGRIAKAAGVEADEAHKTKVAKRIGTMKAKKAKLQPHSKPLEGKEALAAISEAQAKVAAADEEAKAMRKAVKLARKRPEKANGAPKVAKAAKAAPKADSEPKAKRNGTKTELVRGLLTRKEGCTTTDVLAATGWPAVSMPAMAKACGLTLRKEKAKGENTRYFGA